MIDQKLQDTVLAIKECLDRLISPDIEWKDKAWTRAIKRYIGDLGTKMNWRVCASGFLDEFDSEWLYDLVWYREDSDGCLSEIGLILESEWAFDPKRIKYDFEKLLIANAPIKAMVCQAKGSEGCGASDALELLQDRIRAFQVNATTGVYLLAVFDHRKKMFECRQIPSAGLVSAAK